MPCVRTRKNTKIKDGRLTQEQPPTQIPLIIKPYKGGEKKNHTWLRSGFLSWLKRSSLHLIIKLLQFNTNQASFLVVNGHSMVSVSMPISGVYESEKHENSFLCMAYASQETFGMKLLV
ncbi:unnamed protein product [Nyctereutes procyonoides]|uniref:(raccoon dog) hypothetical protein n=1 Tax=Nyctereutes procyonoides TaxID=34880 RepID=A0A811ZWJ3_NYCPR|nr:unnamed protein product [Nyctereutes procyonoides]